MKKLFFSFLSITTCLGINQTSAQIVGTNAYLQGDYVEIGINGNGGYIANATAPAGYHDEAGFTGFGMVADTDKDGWETGSPGFCGDYFEPGSPEEGFAIRVGGVNYANSLYGDDAVGSFVSYSTPPSGPTVTWKGSIAAAGLDITQITAIPAGGSSVLTTVRLKNTSATTMTNVYYTRNVDPDNDLDAGGSFITSNIVVQNHPIDPWAVVTATGTVEGCYLAMASKQSNSKASYGGFSTVGLEPNAAYSGMSPFSITGSTTGDVAIQMSFKINSIAPGATKVINFTYGTNEADLEDLVGFTTDEVARQMEEEINGNLNNSATFQLSPNPSHGEMNCFAYGLGDASDMTIQIADLTGRIVYQSQSAIQGGQSFSQMQLPAELPNGTYLATMRVDGAPVTQPFVLQR
jgi:hypothetical protein